MHSQHDDSQFDSDENGFIRRIGRMLGRIFATLGAAVTMRVVGRDPTLRNNNPRDTSLWREIQNEAPVAATTLVVWNTGFGGDTGASISSFVVENLRNVIAKYIATPAPQPRQQATSFADNLTQNLVAQVSGNAVQGIQGAIFGDNQQPPSRFRIW